METVVTIFSHKMVRKQSRIVFILIFYVPEEFLFTEEEKHKAVCTECP